MAIPTPSPAKMPASGDGADSAHGAGDRSGDDTERDSGDDSDGDSGAGPERDPDAGSRAAARGATYDPPQRPEDDSWQSLGLKVSVSMFVADLVARSCGFDSPTWSVITAAFLATSPPIASARAALRKIAALFVGVALGAAGAHAGEVLAGVPSLHFALIGLVAGVLGSRSADYLFAAVVAAIVTFAGGDDPMAEVVTRTVCTVLIGCAVGPAIVWCVERVKRHRWERRHA